MPILSRLRQPHRRRSLQELWEEYARRRDLYSKDPINSVAYRKLNEAYEAYRRRLAEVESHLPKA